MKKILGCMVITWFFTLPAMETQERTLSIQNNLQKPVVLGIQRRNQFEYRRVLFPAQYGDVYTIKEYETVESLSAYVDGAERGYDIRFADNITHLLLAMNPQHVETVPLDKPLETKYPEFNCLCGYLTSRITNTISYFPGADWYKRKIYSRSFFLENYTQESSDYIPARHFFNLPDEFSDYDLQIAYAEARAKWNPQQFKNCHQQLFAERMIELIEKKYNKLNPVSVCRLK